MSELTLSSLVSQPTEPTGKCQTAWYYCWSGNFVSITSKGGTCCKKKLEKSGSCTIDYKLVRRAANLVTFDVMTRSQDEERRSWLEVDTRVMSCQ